jgi:dihydrofolate reductase
MAGSFHSQFDVDRLDGEARAAFRDALRLAAEKAGRVWIIEGGEMVAQLALAEALADLPGAQ